MDWRDVSFLMSHLSKGAGQDFKTPSQLRQRYRGLREEADSVFAAFNKRTDELKRIVGLKEEYDSLLQAPERLLSDLYRDLGHATMEHPQACPEDLRLDLARGDRNLNAFPRKETGVRKQIQYLRELAVTRIDARIQQLDQEMQKITSKIQKLNLQRRHGKRKVYSKDDIERIRQVKADKWDRRREKTAKMRRRIADFDKYDRGSCASDYLWWDLMTDGSAADDLFEVRDFRQRHPEWNYKTYRDPIESDLSVDAETDAGLFDEAAEELAASMKSSDDHDLFSDPS